jgi:tape measure domain-containing protein
MADERLIFPLGFDLEEGVKEAEKEWKSTYRKKLQASINKTPIKIKLNIDPKGLDLKSLKDYTKLTKEATKAAKDAADVASKRALQRERESKARVAEATEAAKIAKAKAQQEAAEVRLASAKERGAKASRSQTIEYGRQMGYIERLITRLGVYTGIYAAAGMIRDIRETTAEFELQQVALGAIIQDAHEAQVLFSQIKAAAVESPYQIKELVNYTKQLAAYGFEQNALFDTTMKLADISAGLGADMSRIILAVGQISAATVLKGTELRQLTELGIPMVDLLAKKFTQLRGEVVSTGEVFEMISDKAVSFKMVEDILNDLTSVGGMFYDMQRKQAETLAGQWSNLKDSIAIAYDEIGNTDAVRGAMEGTIKTLKNLASEWRLVAGFVGNVATSYAIVKAASLFLPNQVTNTKMLEKATEDLARAQERYNEAQRRGVSTKSAERAKRSAELMQAAAQSTTLFGRGLRRIAAYLAGGGWITVLVSGLTLIVSWFMSARKEANRLNDELKRIGDEGVAEMDRATKNFERLAKIAVDSVDGTREQAEAIKELQRTYGDVIPTQDLTIKNLRSMTDGYNDLTRAIREKIEVQSVEQKISTIQADYGEKIRDEEEKVRKYLNRYFKDLSEGQITRIIENLRNASVDGAIQSANDAIKAMRNALLTEVGLNVPVLKVQKYDEYYEFIKLINQQEQAIKKQTESLKKSQNQLGLFTEAWDNFNNEVLPNIKTTGAEFSFEWNESRVSGRVDAYADFIRRIFKEKGISNILSDEFFAGGKIDFDSLKGAISSIDADFKYPLINLVKEIQEEYDKLIPTDRMSKIIKDKFIEVAQTTGASMDSLQGYLKNADTSVQDWAKSIEEAIGRTETKLTEMTFTNQQIDAGLGGPLLPYTDQEIDDTTNKLDALKTILEWISNFLTRPTSKPEDNRLRNLNEEISLLERVYAKYKEYAKYRSSAEAERMTRDYFGETINQLRFGAAFDSSALSNILRQYQDAARDLPDSEKAVMEIGFKADDASWEQMTEDTKKRVEELAEAVSRSQEAKNFYENMLGMTGDRQLSADLTMSVYGGVGDDLKENIRRQLTEAFRGVDISEAISGNKINYKALEGLIGQLPEEMQANARKIVEEGIKANAEIIQDLYKTLIKFEDYESKRVNILRNGIEERRRIEEADIAQSEKDRLKAASQAAEAKALAKLEYEDFKGSDMYVTMFENLDYVSSDTLKRMKERLLELKTTMGESLDPTQLKEIVSKMEDIDSELSRKNPFKTLAESIRNYKTEYGKIKRETLESDLMTANKERDTAKDDADAKARAVLAQEEMVRLAEEEYGVDSESAAMQRVLLEDAKAELNIAKENLRQKEETLDNLNDQARAWRNIKKAIKEAIEGEDGIVDWLNSTQSMLDSIRSLGEGMGAGEQFSGWMEALGNIVGGAGTTATGIGQILSGQWAQGLANVVKGLSEVTLGIFDASYVDRVAEANAEIEKQTVILGDLEAAYQALERASEDAFGTEYLDNYASRLTALYAMQAAYQAQAEAERAKGKKEDEQATKDFEAQAKEVADQIAEMYGEISERLTGTDLGSAARDFADAWLEAYKTFGNTADAIGTKFREMIDKMVAESVIAGVMKTALKPVFDLIDNMTADDLYNPGFWQDLSSKVESAATNADIGATNAIKMLESMGINIREMGQDLTGISKDIATASEESILGLAAGINTQNFYISQIHAAVLRMEMLMQNGTGGGVNIQDLVTIQNQHLAYLPTIADNTANTLAECRSILVQVTAIADNLGRVISVNGAPSSHQLHATLS